MMGMDIDLPSLKRLWKQVSVKLSARIMKAVSTVDNATGLSTDNLSETTSPVPIRQPNQTEETTDDELVENLSL